MAALADELGISHQAIYNARNKGSVPARWFQVIAQRSGLSEAWLRFGNERDKVFKPLEAKRYSFKDVLGQIIDGREGLPDFTFVDKDGNTYSMEVKCLSSNPMGSAGKNETLDSLVELTKSQQEEIRRLTIQNDELQKTKEELVKRNAELEGELAAADVRMEILKLQAEARAQPDEEGSEDLRNSA